LKKDKKGIKSAHGRAKHPNLYEGILGIPQAWKVAKKVEKDPVIRPSCAVPVRLDEICRAIYD
jgi:hypothetical protein